MTWHHPKYYAELKRRAREQTAAWYKDRKLTSSQASSDKHPNQRTRVQASSQSQQAPGSDDQGTSAQAHVPGCKQRG